MENKHHVPQNVIDAFHMMWDTFPERARLIHKDRTVLAVNRAAEKIGMTAGSHCYDGSPRRAPRGCLANKALRENAGMYSASPEGTRMPFWIPVDGVPDVYVHFSIPSPVVPASDTEKGNE